MLRDNSIVPLPEPLKKELQQQFESRYKFPNGISWEIVWQDWCRTLETQPPTAPTVRAILFSKKSTCEYRIADGLCQLLSKCSYDDWITRLREEVDKKLSSLVPITPEQGIERNEPKLINQTPTTTEATVMWEIHLEANDDLAEAIFALLKKYSGDASLSLRRIKRGSLVLVLEGSREGFERIGQLHTMGELTPLLGVPVWGMRQATSPQTVNLSQWFQHLFDAGWQAVEELLAPQQLSPAFWSAGVKRAKQIELKTDIGSHFVIFVISLTQESEEQINVQLKVYPSGQETYLPNNLQLFVLSDEQVFQTVIARNDDTFIQSQFEGSPGDRFNLRVALQGASITEKFVI